MPGNTWPTSYEKYMLVIFEIVSGPNKIESRKCCQNRDRNKDNRLGIGKGMGRGIGIGINIAKGIRNDDDNEDNDDDNDGNDDSNDDDDLPGCLSPPSYRTKEQTCQEARILT